MTNPPTINAESELVARLRDYARLPVGHRELMTEAADTVERLAAHEPELFVWRDRDVGEPYERSELFLFGVAFMGWASTAFEDGYDGHFYNGLVLGNKPTLADAKALCEYHVQEAFNIPPMSEPHVSAHEQGRREGIEMAAKRVGSIRESYDNSRGEAKSYRFTKEAEELTRVVNALMQVESAILELKTENSDANA